MKVSIIGTGNVGFHLAKALRNAKQIDLVNICGTSYKKAKSIKGQPGTIHTAEIGAMLPTATATLEALAKKLSDDVRLIEDKDRQQVHLSAVLVNNLNNHIIHLAQQRLNDHGIAPDILDSLIMETVRKAAKLGAYHAQTGPARRQDDGVTKSQLAALHNEPQLLDIYKAVTNSITNTYQDK